MALIEKAFLWAANTKAGRKYLQPKRDTMQYPSLTIGGVMLNKQGGVIRYLPENLRMFSRTPYVRRAINAIKSPISQLKWEIKPVEGVKENSEIKRQIEIATACFNFPNNQNHFTELLELSLEDYLTYGSIAIEQQIGGDENRPLWLFPVDTRSIQVYPAWSGNKNEARYVQTLGYSNIDAGEARQIRDDELIYLTANKSNEAPFGWGAVQIAYLSIARLLGSEEFAGKLASNMYPSFMFVMDNFNEQEMAQFINKWRNEVEGQGGIPTFALPKSTGTAKNINKVDLKDNKKDPYSLEWQEACIRSIAAAFNLSPQNLNLERDINRNTSEVAEDRDWDQTIIPIARAIAKAFTFNALQKKLGFYNIEFKFVGLEREDELATAQIFEIDYKNNAMTPNEYRIKKGEQPLDNQWGDMLNADVTIAVEAARGAKQVDDPNLTSNPKAQSNVDPSTQVKAPKDLTSDKDKKDNKANKKP